MKKRVEDPVEVESKKGRGKERMNKERKEQLSDVANCDFCGLNPRHD